MEPRWQELKEMLEGCDGCKGGIRGGVVEGWNFDPNIDWGAFGGIWDCSHCNNQIWPGP